MFIGLLSAVVPGTVSRTVPARDECPPVPLPQKLNEVAASLFVSAEDARVAEGVGILNELIIPCMHLMNSFHISKEDLDALEATRSRWCSYLGREDIDGRSGVPFLRVRGQGGVSIGRELWGGLQQPP